MDVGSSTRSPEFVGRASGDAVALGAGGAPKEPEALSTAAETAPLRPRPNDSTSRVVCTVISHRPPCVGFHICWMRNMESPMRML